MNAPAPSTDTHTATDTDTATNTDTGTAEMPTAPTRARPFEKTATRTPGWLRRLLGRELALSREEYQAAVDDLWVGDPAMDALIDWMYEYGPAQARPLFEKAVRDGVDAVPDCPAPLKAFMDQVAAPAWLDPGLVDEGARFIQSTGMAAPYVLRDLALMGGYLLSGFNQSLVLTGALSRGTARRVAETGKWWIDCTEEGGLNPGGEGYRGTLYVRMVHGLVRRNLDRREEWEHARWGLPLNQVDMAATYLGFCVVMLGGLRKMGIPVTARESRAVMHLWKYAGWLMGVDERWLVDRERDGIVLLHHAMMTQSRPDWTSQELGRALSREPLSQSFSRWAAPRQRWAYWRHLSVTRYFLSREKMRQLGLPDNVGPWFPIATLVPRFLVHVLMGYLPGLRGWRRRRGRRVQNAALNHLFPDGDHGLVKADL